MNRVSRLNPNLDGSIAKKRLQRKESLQSLLVTGNYKAAVKDLSRTIREEL
jgi:hypothetical protein